jgi:hypothetical protein
MTYRGHVKNGVILIDDPVCLADGTQVSVCPVEGAPAGQPAADERPDSAFWQGLGVSELAEQQHVPSLRSLEDLAGDWPEDESLDEFFDSLHRDRT